MHFLDPHGVIRLEISEAHAYIGATRAQSFNVRAFQTPTFGVRIMERMSRASALLPFRFWPGPIVHMMKQVHKVNILRQFSDPLILTSRGMQVAHADDKRHG
jgi:hypothetical protein